VQYRRYRYQTKTANIGPIPIPSTGIGLSLIDSTLYGISILFFINDFCVDLVWELEIKLSNRHLFESIRYLIRMYIEIESS